MSMLSGDPRSLSFDAYTYLYPLVTMEVTRRQMVNVEAGSKPGCGPPNEFHHIRAFPPADFRAVVRPNFDTLYSSAWLDLTAGPVVLHTADTSDRYFMLPMLDMWTDVFANPGKRTSGTGAQDYVVVGPRHSGDLPAGKPVIEAPTPWVWVIGRTQTNGPADYAAVGQIQDGFAISPLSRWGQAPAPVEPLTDPSVDVDTEPLAQVAGLPARAFFTLGAELLATHRPHVTDRSILARMRRIGLGEPFDYAALDPAVQDALDGVPAAALERVRAAIPRQAPIVNGRETITASIGVYGNEYLRRAVVAMAGLGANPPEDAIYPLNVFDAEGQPLNGDHDYVLHFERDQLPPVHAFWSVTMYDDEGFQVANAINRFAIGDRDELTFNADGSLDLHLQHDSPGAERESNWLPAPRGPLGVTLRLYAPGPEALDGRWSPPPIRRVPASANGGGPR